MQLFCQNNDILLWYKMFKSILFFFLFFLYTTSSFAECAKPEMPSNKEWNDWLIKTSKEAIEHGINKDILDKEFLIQKPLQKIIMRDRCQPESTITFKEYIYYRLGKTRIYKGKKNKNKYEEELKEISLIYDIKPEIILSIWGLESFYGNNQGESKVISVLTTLTFDKRRSDFYKKQLFAALKMLQNNFIDSDKLVGSWAGAMGQVQFLPTTYLDSAVDFDKDGKKDIWNNEMDIFASIANYLTSLEKAPWDNNYSWGFEVNPPINIDSFYDTLKQENPKGCYAVRTMSKEKNLSEWSNLGFKIKNEFAIDDSNPMMKLVAPDGIDGRMFLVYRNYKSILYYNCSHYYALSVGLLSDKIME